ncbi:MAG: DivIVA domain-containing protein [Ilumatobacteraceae bacterium]
MELTPQAVRATTFKTVRKGYDPTEVDGFKERAASAIESAQNQATAMEARARAAVAKLQELTQAGAAPAAKDEAPTPAGEPKPVEAAAEAAAPAAPEAVAAAPAELKSDDAETISRTLLLAQRTADTTVAEAQREAETILTAARAEATKIVEDARVEGRKANESERIKAENEVQALVARRDFLVGDVDSLEQHIVTQRERLRDTASAIQEMIDRVPAGLGDVRRPLLSASDTPASGTPVPAAPAEEVHDPE